eukprot:5828523-Prorocentrum_lima.AAC.1
MTSSLVGSEMCIRDRIKCPPPSKKEIMLQQEDQAVRMGELYLPQATRAVSYTHLTLPTICSV